MHVVLSLYYIHHAVSTPVGENTRHIIDVNDTCRSIEINSNNNRFNIIRLNDVWTAYELFSYKLRFGSSKRSMHSFCLVCFNEPCENRQLSVMSPKKNSVTTLFSTTGTRIKGSRSCQWFKQRKMKSACIFLLSLVCLTVTVQCYGRSRLYNLREFIKAHRTKGSSNYVTEEGLGIEYSPVYVENQDGLKEADKITDLPGQPEVSFSQYSGYVTVDPSAGRALFYYFAESPDSSTKPLVLWLNGGPGCSSLGAGAMTELGPFRVNPDGKTLWHNKNAWNNVANVIFLESPAGVGFSYSNTSSDYNTGDKQTAADTYTFLVNWLERFPEYKTRNFYITGESYAGHYVPQLAALILKNNKITNQTVINLAGIAIGNAYIDDGDNSRGQFDYYWSHALMSDEIHEGIVKNCNNFSSGGSISEACQDYEEQAYEAIGNIFDYDIYAPLCSSPSNPPPVSGFDPCSHDYVYKYLNTPDVQQAMHANATGIPGPWDSCSGVVNYKLDDLQLSIIPTIQELMASDISIWIYSGDTDSVVPVTATKYSLAKIGADVMTPWYPWYTQGEVGGYAVGYEKITFVTVRGAGHFVPSYQPERALTMFASFLGGELPPRQG